MAEENNGEVVLLHEIACGSGAAMNEFYTRYAGCLMTVCSRYVADRNDAEDILQESFMKIFRALPSFQYRGSGSIRAWASRIVVNESLKFLKGRQRLLIIDKPESDLPDVPESEEMDSEEIPITAVLAMIQALPDGYRTVFNLYVFERKSHREIASLLGISESTSASQLHRAKRMLVGQINDYKQIKSTESHESQLV